MRLLLAWLSKDDLLHVQGDREKPLTLTPALRASNLDVDRVVLLSNLPADANAEFVEWLGCRVPVEIRSAPLSSPVDYIQIHARAVEAIAAARKAHGAGLELSFLLNSGTAPMGSVWLLLGKSQYRAKLLAWSNFDQALIEVKVPFSISADFVPELLDDTDRLLKSSSGENAREQAAFSDIICRCKAMKALLEKGRRIAPHSVPVLIEGETGTGKELLARAIHRSSPRSSKPFVAVNCSAIPENLIESELFGHVKGAFTGASGDRQGHFRAADGGTLFLDEIGELPLALQVKLLRPLQESEVQPVGSSTVHRVDVRVIAATHRDLLGAIGQGTFREDLFYRLAVAVLQLPPLREREGDLQLLVDRLLEDINQQNQTIGLAPRTLSPEARNRLREHAWPGNVRELVNTLRRAVVWSAAPRLERADIDEALFKRSAEPELAEVLTRPLGGDFELDVHLAKIQEHYIDRAMTMSGGKKVEAAKLLGFRSHQVLTNRLRRAKS